MILLFQNFIQLFQARQDMLWAATWEHLQLSIISLLLSVFIALPLGIILTRNRRIAEPVIGASAVLQTIPSLALLGFMIPLIGIGTTPAIVALTAYALLPILRNTYTGIREVDPSLVEAARGMGMSSIKRLHKVELPIAMPVIMAGIRTSMVLIVGTATLAALIGAGGLGDLIMLGIARSNNEYILLGAIPAALLALFFDAVLRVTEKRSGGSSIMPIVSVVVVALLIVSAPLVIRPQQADITIGGKLGSEPEIIINMHKLLIEDATDLVVDLEPNLGQTDFVFNAIQSGNIDIYLEFAGTAIMTFLDEELETNDEQEVFEMAKEGMDEEYGLVFLDPMEFNNTYAIAMMTETADELGVETISDLRNYNNELTAGFTHEFADRQDGYLGIQEVYDVNFDVVTMEAGLRPHALQSGDIDLMDAYATDWYIVEYDMTVLEDDETLFPPYQGAPLVRRDILEQYPEIENVLNQLGGRISDEQMQEMNHRVEVGDENASDVAREFLVSEGLLAE
ncbi:ABC transporter permease/substrate-binding protein [Alteribacter keqinensis]|uniref:ABC transporter permease/substrate-binding protein n=1 Tax=Alteribacter keqinensis TaxID=2483800 RepID=A0A3M7TY85_9BACI|nr:ABC transporter permease/substrate-binding protein [Alteribacter keqinensis]RNA69395.1 ABC transporter permease/substrate-binding protein [Alteribacter keqinensis]